MTQFLGAQRTKLLADYSSYLHECLCRGIYLPRAVSILKEEARSLTISDLQRRIRQFESTLDSFDGIDGEDSEA